MRLTINLQPELYALARTLAHEENCSLSTAVNRLIQRGLQPEESRGDDDKPIRRNGILVARGHRPFGGDLIKELEAEDDL